MRREPSPTTALIIPGFRQAAWMAVRGLALLFMLSCVVLFVLGSLDYLPYARLHLAEIIPFTPIWSSVEFISVLAQFGLSIDLWLRFSFVTSILLALVFGSVGFLIFLRRGDEPFGLYVAVVFVLFGTFSGNGLIAFAGLRPELKPVLTPLGVLAWWGLFLLLFLFPNGRFVPGWTRWTALLLLVVYILVIAVYGGEDTPPATLVAAILALFGVGAGSQVYRYRRISTLTERQQTKWVMGALVIVFIFLIISLAPLVFPEILRPGLPSNLIALVTSQLPNVLLNIIPLSVAFAILRYRLWDIDLIIRRTLQYGVLTILLGLAYLGIVITLGQFLIATSGQSSALIVVLSTLAIAALFNPLRLRLQVFIDRRFFRSRYNAEQAVAAFSIASRRQVEPGALAEKLVAAAQEALQPQDVWVWLRKNGKADGRKNPG